MLVQRGKLIITLLLLAAGMGCPPSLTAQAQGLDRVAANVSFELDIQPILTAYSCNSGPCHGKAPGQNGFKLSLLGFDPEFDFAALTTQSRGRRVFPAAPERSLLLLKATAQVPHGGGLRSVESDSRAYEVLLGWIESGTPRRIDGEPQLERVTVAPTQQEMKTGDTGRLASDRSLHERDIAT